MQDKLNGKVTQSDIARATGTSRANISKLFAKNSFINDEKIEKIEEYFNINFNDVQSGLIYMDYFTGDVAKIIEGKVKFSEKFIRTAIPCAIFPYENGAQYIICHSNDDSMFPLINKGDFVIIKKIESVDNIDSRIYLFLYKNNIYIKRLNKNINQIVVFSENKEYKTQYISNEDMKDLYILGEIVYTGHAIGQK